MISTPHIRLHALVRGRVQGVGFRDFTQSSARMLGVTGWVRNLPDGETVEVVAEGLRDRLDGLVGRLWRGPGGSAVTHVEVCWQAAEGRFHGFEVRYR